MMYGLGALLLGGAALAIYERRKGLRLREDPGPDATRDPARAAYTEAERIRAETQTNNPPHGGGTF